MTHVPTDAVIGILHRHNALPTTAATPTLAELVSHLKADDSPWNGLACYEMDTLSIFLSQYGEIERAVDMLVRNHSSNDAPAWSPTNRHGGQGHAGATRYIKAIAAAESRDTSAVTLVVDAMCRMDEAWGQLTCDEVDAFSRLMAENGAGDRAAELIVIYHQATDEDPRRVQTSDRHFGMDHATALAHVRALVV